MRYADRIIFIKETEGGLNPSTGNHDEAVKTETEFPCNISTMGVNRSVELFGKLDSGVIVARLQRRYNEPFDHVEVPKGQYKGTYNLRGHMQQKRKSVFILEGAKS